MRLDRKTPGRRIRRGLAVAYVRGKGTGTTAAASLSTRADHGKGNAEGYQNLPSRTSCYSVQYKQVESEVIVNVQGLKSHYGRRESPPLFITPEGRTLGERHGTRKYFKTFCRHRRRRRTPPRTRTAAERARIDARAAQPRERRRGGHTEKSSRRGGGHIALCLSSGLLEGCGGACGHDGGQSESSRRAAAAAPPGGGFGGGLHGVVLGTFMS